MDEDDKGCTLNAKCCYIVQSVKINTEANLNNLCKCSVVRKSQNGNGFKFFKITKYIL